VRIIHCIASEVEIEAMTGKKDLFRKSFVARDSNGDEMIIPTFFSPKDFIRKL